MTQPIEPITRRKLSDEVFDRLENMITSGELTPGDEMPSERVLMERFGVGRPAIREAMQSLAKMGLVSISHGERAKVLKLTARSILQQVDPTAKIMLAQSLDTLEASQERANFLRARYCPRSIAQKATRTRRMWTCAQIMERQRESLGDADAFISLPIWNFISGSRELLAIRSSFAVSEAMLAWLREYHTHMLIWTGKENIHTRRARRNYRDCLPAKDCGRRRSCDAAPS
jgi:DNA-binding transcriptional regulator YhcF (GntR family)